MENKQKETNLHGEPPAPLYVKHLEKLSINFVNFLELLGTGEVVRAEEVLKEQVRVYNVWKQDRDFWIHRCNMLKKDVEDLKNKLRREFYLRIGIIVTSSIILASSIIYFTR